MRKTYGRRRRFGVGVIRRPMEEEEEDSWCYG